MRDVIAWCREGAILRQMTDGRHLIQLIYDADENLQDCQYVTDADMRLQFMDAFSREYQQMSGRIPAGLQFHNVTMRDIQQVEDLPDDLSSLFNYRLLRKKCRQVHRRILKESLAKQSGQGQRLVNQFCSVWFLIFLQVGVVGSRMGLISACCDLLRVYKRLDLLAPLLGEMFHSRPADFLIIFNNFLLITFHCFGMIFDDFPKF